MQDPQSLLPIAIEAAQRAAVLLLDGLGRASSVTTKSSGTDMVSEMDRGAEDVIRRVLSVHRPDDAVLGEEAGQSEGNPTGQGTGVRWIVDPLDGTTNFLYGLPAWCVSIAAEVDGVVVSGAVYDTIHDEMWTATKGGGAALNGAPLSPLGGDAGLATALVATGFSYVAERRAVQGRIAAHVLPRVRDLRRAGSAALDLCWVAGGRVDAYFEETTRIWDRAAGGLIAAEAGAWVGGYDGGAPSDAGVVAARPALAHALRELLDEARRSAQALEGPPEHEQAVSLVGEEARDPDRGQQPEAEPEKGPTGLG